MNNITEYHDDTNSNYYGTAEVDLRFILVRVFYPCLLIWGTIGNALCLRVLLSKKFFKNSTCQYLAVLAVIDILFILMRSSKHIYKLFRETPIFNTSQLVCRILTFFSSALAHMASWILVIVSFDRYVIVTSGHQRRNGTANQVLCSTGILIAIVVLCNIYYFFILGRTMTWDHPNTNVKSNSTVGEDSSEQESVAEMLKPKSLTLFTCIPKEGYEQFFSRYIPIFDILLVAVIPFIFLCFTNIGIIVYTMRTNRRMRQHRRRNNRHQRVTIMLLSVTLAFIGLTCPSVIFICVNKIVYSPNINTSENISTVQSKPVRVSQKSNVQWIIEICEALWYTKHAMNFILYTLSGQDFRREFLKLFPKCFHRRSNMNSKFVNAPVTQNDQGLESLLDESNTKRNDHAKLSPMKLTLVNSDLSNTD